MKADVTCSAEELEGMLRKAIWPAGKCDHVLPGSLVEVRSGSGALLRYRCRHCGKSFAIGRMYMEPVEI